jgi:hypothetical protein
LARGPPWPPRPPQRAWRGRRARGEGKRMVARRGAAASFGTWRGGRGWACQHAPRGCSIAATSIVSNGGSGLGGATRQPGTVPRAHLRASSSSRVHVHASRRGPHAISRRGFAAKRACGREPSRVFAARPMCGLLGGLWHKHVGLLAGQAAASPFPDCSLCQPIASGCGAPLPAAAVQNGTGGKAFQRVKADEVRRHTGGDVGLCGPAPCAKRARQCVPGWPLATACLQHVGTYCPLQPSCDWGHP